VHQFVEGGLAVQGEAAVGQLARLDAMAERELLFGAQAGPARGLVEVVREAVRLAGMWLIMERERGLYI